LAIVPLLGLKMSDFSCKEVETCYFSDKKFAVSRRVA